MAECVSVRISQRCQMAPIFLFFLCSLLSHFQPGIGGPVFLSGRAADGVLRRHKRYNTGIFEEWLQGNLERECIEEICDLEEARETFENDEKTMEFWAGYVDGNQCKSSPCLNQGSCTDGTGYYTCNCLSGFTGMNCEIVVAKRCDVNNGDCMHFCESMGTFGATCSCATGYTLMPDLMNCEPQAEFPCGRTALKQVSAAHGRSLFNPEEEEDAVLNSTSLTNTTTSTTTSPPPAAANTTTSSPATVDPVVYPPRRRPIKRIVGGEEVTPGEIPWQVALVMRHGGMLFCGGSILSQRWVITAAHCLEEAKGPFFVRVGEHNIYTQEGTERDHDVLEQHIHPRYNASVSLYNHDIALLCLSSPISFSTKVRPICIGPTAFIEKLVKEYSPATVSGWGRTRFLGATSYTLQQVEVPYTDRTECKASSSARITPFMFCAGYYDEAKDACQGDSGGPHTNSIHDTWFLTGIVSWGEECAKAGKYGVYTRVSIYYPWIRHVIGLTKHRLAFDIEEPDP